MSRDAPDRVDRSRAVASELRLYAEGALDVDHRDVGREVGLVDDDETRGMMTWSRGAWDRHASEVLDERDDLDVDADRLDRTEWYQSRVELQASETVGRAVRDDDVSRMEFATGVPSYESDVSGLHTVADVEEWLTSGEQTSLIYLAGIMGSGKTDFAVSLLQIIWWHYRRLREQIASVQGASVDDVPEPDLATNFRVEATDDVDVDLLDTFDDLDAWAAGGSSDMVRWFIFDEASSELTAQSGSNAQDVAEVMAPFVKKMRKKGVNMIVIGHDRQDVHPAIREIADFVDKRGTKKATVYEGISNRKPKGKLFDLDKIPPTDWNFDTDDLAEWSWGSALDDDGGLGESLDPLDTDDFRDWRDERIRTLYRDYDLTQEDVAEVMDLSARRVRQVV
jgi:hypothetical protein